jgi:hypothetical protein
MRKARGVRTPTAANVNGSTDRRKLVTVEIQPGRLLICDTDAAIENGTHVLVRLWDGKQLEGRVSSPYPDRVSTLNINLETGGTLKRIRKASVFRVVSVQTNQ